MNPNKLAEQMGDKLPASAINLLTDDNQKDALAGVVWSYFEESKRDRQVFEQQWMKDRNQYEGIYSEKVRKNIKDGFSDAYMRLTRAKVRLMDAWMNDMLFPGGSSSEFWSIAATPMPELSAENTERVINRAIQLTLMTAQQELQRPLYPEEAQQLAEQVRTEMDQEKVAAVVDEAAEEAVANMRRLMKDQISESSYVKENMKVIHSGNLYGTGVLKGPMTEAVVKPRWVQNPETGQYGMMNVEERRPFYQFVDLWDLYPDLSASCPEDAGYMIERHVLPRHKVRKLKNQMGMDAEKIDQYLLEVPGGDAERLWHETAREGDSKPFISRHYEVLEMWGMLSGKELQDHGVDIPEDRLNEEFEANVWVLGPYVIKAQLNPTAQESRPYKFYYLEEKEGCIFGRGIAELMADADHLFNAALRMMIDNAARASGPIIEADMDTANMVKNALPWTVVTRGNNSDPQYRAITIHKFPSMVKELMALQQWFKELGDETTTLPAFMGGDEGGLSGAGDTATGLSMLMGAAKITVKDVVNNYDQGVTKPAISDMYHYNMQFSERQDVKGDMEIIAEGSRSLIARELRVQQTKETLQMANNPEDKKYVNRHKLWIRLAEDSALPEGVVRDEEEVDMINELEAQVQKMTDMLVQFEIVDPQTGQMTQKAGQYLAYNQQAAA